MKQSIFWQLYYAIVDNQGGVTNLRRIMSPMFDDATGDEATAGFYADGKAADESEQETVINGLSAANLFPPAPPTLAAQEPATPPQDAPQDDGQVHTEVIDNATIQPQESTAPTGQ